MKLRAYASEGGRLIAAVDVVAARRIAASLHRGAFAGLLAEVREIPLNQRVRVRGPLGGESVALAAAFMQAPGEVGLLLDPE